MPIFERGDVVRVPFPYTDRPVRQHRPALVLATPGAADADRGDAVELVWVLMITSATNRWWPDDVEVESGRANTGLPVPSIVRTRKIATIDAAHAERIGNVSSATLRLVTERVQAWLAG